MSESYTDTVRNHPFNDLEDDVHEQPRLELATVKSRLNARTRERDAALKQIDTLVDFIRDVYERVEKELDEARAGTHPGDNEYAARKRLQRIIDRFDVSYDDADTVMELIGYHPRDTPTND